jgi:hypothetical protein
MFHREKDGQDLLVDFAIAMLELNIPIPVDLETKLLERGIDVSFLKLKYGS